MKKHWKLLILALCAAVLLLTGRLARSAQAPEAEAAPTPAQTVPVTTAAPTEAPEMTEAFPAITLALTQEEQEMLLKLGMAELGHTECETCIALVMRTVLNRLDAGGYGKTIYGVLHAKDQFTPVMDGSYEKAEPNDACFAALDMVLRGWDESQGALFYEFCRGASWHSKNLTLLTEHCNTRFYK